jgi:hypothetical protein
MSTAEKITLVIGWAVLMMMFAGALGLFERRRQSP